MPEDQSMELPTPGGGARHLPAIACVVAGLCFAGFFCESAGVPAVVAAPGMLLLICAGLVYRDHLPSQILVRAALWSNLILGMVIAASDSSVVGLVLALATATGLLSLGRQGLDAPSETFAPVAFRGSLMIALVMALADTQSLALFGTIEADHDAGILTLACAGLMIVGLVGLYRLELWGLVVNLGANLAIAYLALNHYLDLPGPIVTALCTTALIQVVLPLPLLVAMVRGQAPEPTAGQRQLRAVIVPATVVALAAGAVVGFILS